MFRYGAESTLLRVSAIDYAMPSSIFQAIFEVAELFELPMRSRSED
jgi:hypothetical protein